MSLFFSENNFNIFSIYQKRSGKILLIHRTYIQQRYLSISFNSYRSC